jgi:hypothetical protein
MILSVPFPIEISKRNMRMLLVDQLLFLLFMMKFLRFLVLRKKFTITKLVIFPLNY